MSEWWTYGLADFLLFSPRVYSRLIERYNQAIWPGQILALAAGIAIVAMYWRPSRLNHRVLAVLLALCWLWVAWAWFGQRYLTINWAASYMAWAFAAQAVLLVAIGTIGSWRESGGRTHCIGLGFLLFGVMVMPAIGPLVGRPWWQVEPFGVMPDPTVIATFGVLLAARGWLLWVPMAVPLAWCIVSGATLWAMDEPVAWVLPLGGLLALVAAAARPLRPAPDPVHERSHGR